MGETKLNLLNTKPDVYQHHDYREFLHEWVSYMKSAENLSMRQISKQLGISHGYISLVIDRQRNLSEKMLFKLQQLLKFDNDQFEFFRALIKLSDARDQKERVKAYELMQSKIAYKKINIKEPVTFKYLDSWLHVTIREFATTGNLHNDAKAIKKLIPYKVSQRAVQKSIDFLIKNDFLKESGDQLIATDKDINCLGGVFQLSLGNFHKEMLEMAKNGIDIHKKEDRKQTGYTMAISRDDFDEVKQILEEAKQKIKDLERKSKLKKDTVYHVNFSAFPLIGKESK